MSINTPAACVLLCDGFEETEAVTVVDVLRRAGVQTSILGVNTRTVTGSHGVTLKVDAALQDVVDLGTVFDAVVLPGGMPGATNLRDSDRARDFVRAQRSSGATLAAICAAPMALGHWGLLHGRRATCFPGFEGELTGADVVEDPVVVDDGVITSRAVGTALAFALSLVRILVDEAEAARLAQSMLVREIER